MKKLIIIAVMLAGSLASFAQKAKANSAENKTDTAVTKTYTCPMHPQVTSDKPGTCSKCGMNLSLSKKEQMKMEVMKTYTCPMHPDVTSTKKGKCPKCGMDMVEKKQTVKSKS